MNPRGTMDVICDIDGTVADLAHRRIHIAQKPKDWKNFFRSMDKDEPIWPIIDLVTALDAAQHRIIFCSGREDTYREITEFWLGKHGIKYGPLYMRKKGDYRADDIVKAELLGQIIEDGFSPELVIDDRARVVNMWRSKGLICIQVADGDF